MRGVLDVFCKKKTSLYEATGRSTTIAGNKTKKSSDESPTDQEPGLGDRAHRAYRVQLTVRDISFGCLIFGGAHSLQFSFL